MTQKNLHHQHKDYRWGSNKQALHKGQAMANKDHTILIQTDDKSSIRVAEPGERLAALDKPGRSLVSTDPKLRVSYSDHAAGKSVSNLVPTITLIPDLYVAEETNSFYQGKPLCMVVLSFYACTIYIVTKRSLHYCNAVLVIYLVHST